MTYENMILELRNAAEEWRAKHPAVSTFETRYDLALFAAADAIHQLSYHADAWERLANCWRERYEELERQKRGDHDL